MKIHRTDAIAAAITAALIGAYFVLGAYATLLGAALWFMLTIATGATIAVTVGPSSTRR